MYMYIEQFYCIYIIDVVDNIFESVMLFVIFFFIGICFIGFLSVFIGVVFLELIKFIFIGLFFINKLILRENINFEKSILNVFNINLYDCRGLLRVQDELDKLVIWQWDL